MQAPNHRKVLQGVFSGLNICLLPPLTDVQPHTQYCRKQKDDKGNCIYQLFIKIVAGKMEQEKMDIRLIRKVRTTQNFSYLPVPVGAGTIALAIPNAQHKPGECRKQYRYQMQLSCFRKSPTYNIKECKRCMKKKEENI